MNISIDTNDRNLIVAIVGDIDHHISDQVRGKIEKDYSRLNARNIIFDFSQVSFMDSSGIGMVIGRYKEVEKKGGKVVISNISGSAKKIFDMSGLFKIIKDFETVDDALEYLK